MRDPHEVLGISPNATEEEIKNAYRNLAKKYHPDNYSDSNMHGYATEKMKEINEAYDMVINGKRRSSRGCDYNEVRNLIRNNRLNEAENILNSVPSSSRNAEWYYLRGTIYLNYGWVNDAENCFRTAVSYDPDNAEYASAYNRLRNNKRGDNGGYNTTSMNNPSSGCFTCSSCDVCTGLMCADCCCECMGGDCIRCI